MDNLSKFATTNYNYLKIILAVILISGSVLFSYSNSLKNSFHFDDKHSIVENQSIRQLNIQDIYHSNNPFRVVGFTSFAINYHFHNLDDMSGWHLVNISLHIICSILIFALFYNLTSDLVGRNFSIPFVAALLFACHPICSEPVNYIQARHVQFYTMFALFGAYAVSQGLRSNKIFTKSLWFIGMIICCVLGLHSKEVGLFYVPCGILLTYGVLRLKDWDFKSLFKYRPLLIVVASVTIFMMVAHWIRPLTSIFSFNHNPIIGERKFFTNLLTQCSIFFQNMYLFIPSSKSLNVDHYYLINQCDTFLRSFQATISFIFFNLLIVLGIIQRNKRPFISFCILWMVMGALPYMLASGGSAELRVEYKIYISAVGMVGLVSFFLNQAYLKIQLFKNNKIYFWVLVSGIIFWCIHETRTRNLVWRNDISLWADAVSKSPQKGRCYFNLGLAYDERGETNKAFSLYKKALKRSPYFYKVYNNIAAIYLKKSDPDQALPYLKHALKLEGNDVECINNMGIYYMQKRQTDEAIESFQKVLRINSFYAGAHNNLGLIYLNLKEWKPAVNSFNAALDLQPANIGIKINFARSLMRVKRFKDASMILNQIIKKIPKDINIQILLIQSLMKLGEFEEAHQKALGICEMTSYQDPECLYFLAVTYENKGNSEKAQSIAKNAINLAKQNKNKHLIGRIIKTFFLPSK